MNSEKAEINKQAVIQFFVDNPQEFEALMKEVEKSNVTTQIHSS